LDDTKRVNPQVADLQATDEVDSVLKGLREESPRYAGLVI